MKLLITAVFIIEFSVAVAKEYPDSPGTWLILGLLAQGTATAADGLRASPLFLVGCALTVVSTLIRLRCYKTLGRFFTYEVAIRPQHRLITDGPYAYVRHPSYTALLFCLVGLSVCHGSSGSWMRECKILDTPGGLALIALYAAYALPVTVAFLRRAPLEDTLLRKEFGEQWEQWAERVPYRLIPFVW